MSDAEKIASRSEDLHELQKTLSELQEATAQEMRKAIAFETRRLQIYKQISNRLQEECAPLFEKYGGPDDYRIPASAKTRTKRQRLEPTVSNKPLEYRRNVETTSVITERRQSLRSRSTKSPASTTVSKKLESESVPSDSNGSFILKDPQVASVSNEPLRENFATSSVMTVIPTSSINSVTTNGPTDALFAELSNSLKKRSIRSTDNLPKIYLQDVCKANTSRRTSPLESIEEKTKAPIANGIEGIKVEMVWVSDTDEREKSQVEEQNCFDPLETLCTKGVARGSKKSVKSQLKKIKGEKMDDLLYEQGSKTSKVVKKIKSNKRSNNKFLPNEFPKTSAERYRRRNEVRKLSKAVRSAEKKWSNAELLRTMDAFVQLNKPQILNETLQIARVKVE